MANKITESADVTTRNILNKIRKVTESKTYPKYDFAKVQSAVRVLNEEKDPNKPIAITDDPKFGSNVLTNQIEEFKSAVDSGAEFGKGDEKNVSSSPLIYLPKDKNLIFSGLIPRLGNLQFQLKLKTDTGDGAWIFIPDGMVLTEKNLEKINRLYQFYENWKAEWDAESGDLERMAEHENS